MDDVIAARLLHVVAVILWIGGVGMVTTVLLPTLRRRSGSVNHVAIFELIEHRFARQARWTVPITGLTGLYMVCRLDLWHRFLTTDFWWMHAMVGIWLLFSLLLFVLEPLFLHAWFQRRALAATEKTFAAAIWMHRILLAASLITIAGAVAGSHG